MSRAADPLALRTQRTNMLNTRIARPYTHAGNTKKPSSGLPKHMMLVKLPCPIWMSHGNVKNCASRHFFNA